jgi:hypothetical protein
VAWAGGEGETCWEDRRRAGWDEYTAARARFFARLAADRVLREVAGAVQREMVDRAAAAARARMRP